MKKLFLAVALVMGLGTSAAFANNMVSDVEIVTMIKDRKSTRLNSSHYQQSRMPSSASLTSVRKRGVLPVMSVL